MKVLLVSSSYPFHRDDYHALFVHGMARALVARGAAVTVVTPRTPESVSGNESWDGVSVRRFDYAGLGHPLLNLTGRDGLWRNLVAQPAAGLALPGLWRALRRAVSRATRLGPDLIVSHWLVPGGLAVPRTTCPTVHIAHGSEVGLLRRLPGGRSIVRRVLRTGRIVASSSHLARRLAPLMPGRATPPVVTMGVEPPPPGLRHVPAGAALRLCGMGRLVPGKGWMRALDVLDRLPGATLTIAGDGRLRDALARRIREDRLRAEIVPPVTGLAKSRFLADHHLMLCLPDTDNRPVAAVESLAHGTPVVATRTGDLPHLLRDGGGLVVPADTDAIADSIAALGTADRDRMRAEARRVGGRFTWDDCLRRMTSHPA